MLDQPRLPFRSIGHDAISGPTSHLDLSFKKGFISIKFFHHFAMGNEQWAMSIGHDAISGPTSPLDLSFKKEFISTWFVHHYWVMCNGNWVISHLDK